MGNSLSPFRRVDLHAIARTHLPKADRVKMVKKLQHMVELVAKCRANDGMIYSARSKLLVKQEVIGAFWKDQNRQRRVMLKIAPERRRGRRFIYWHRVLISSLGAHYYAGTGKIPTRRGTDGPESAFERFAAPFLHGFGVTNPKNLVREYLIERRRTDPYGWCALYGSRKQMERALARRSSMN
jgi:hypothetical protein